jgi:hypothetical protein
MATEQNLRNISREADSSVGVFTGPPGLPGSAVPNTGKQYRFLKITGRNQVGLCTAGTDVVAGILQNKPQGAGHAATVGYEGESKVVAGVNNIAAGDLVVPDGQGRATNVSATGGVWQATMPSSAVGELISVMKVK